MSCILDESAEPWWMVVGVGNTAVETVVDRRLIWNSKCWKYLQMKQSKLLPESELLDQLISKHSPEIQICYACKLSCLMHNLSSSCTALGLMCTGSSNGLEGERAVYILTIGSHCCSLCVVNHQSHQNQQCNGPQQPGTNAQFLLFLLVVAHPRMDRLWRTQYCVENQ